MLNRRRFLGTMAGAGAAVPSIAMLSRALIAEAVAEIKGLPLQQVVAATTANFDRLFATS